MQVSFQTQNYCFLVEFNQSLAAVEIAKHLPLNSKVSTWGDEIYFETGIVITDGNASSQVNVGDIAYWPEGRSICVFFGPTPSSHNGKPVPASPVVIIGKTIADPEELRKIQAGHPIRIMPVVEKPSVPSAQASQYERKLSQSEIDVLVKQLLIEKQKRQQN